MICHYNYLEGSFRESRFKRFLVIADGVAELFCGGD